MERAFWYVLKISLRGLIMYRIRDRVLVALDKVSSAALGRPCAIHDEE